MAKQIKFTLGGKDFPIVLGRKVSKDDLYGKVKRVVYDFFDITGTDDPAAEDEDDELDFAMM